MSIHKATIPLFLLLTLSFSPAYALVEHGRNGQANYSGVAWHFETINESGGDCAAPSPSACLSPKPNYWIEMTVITDGNIVCNQSYDFTNEASSFDGRGYPLCGGTVKISGNPNNTMRAAFNDQWVDSPAHCRHAGVINYVCDHYWYQVPAGVSEAAPEPSGPVEPREPREILK